MKKLWIKISAIVVVFLFLGVVFVSSSIMNNHTSVGNPLNGAIATNNPASSSDPSVHLYVNGNGYVVFSANYSMDGISFHFDNDKSQNFTTNDVPTGTVFHLVSSPNSGYAFQKWTGTVNSTNNSIYITVNQNVNEEAIYQKESFFAFTFMESGLPSNDLWYVNLSNGLDSGPISGSSYSFSLSNATYSYTIASSNKSYSPIPSSGSFTVNGSAESQSIAFTEVKYAVTFTESGLPAGTAWYVNITNGVNSGTITGTSYTVSLPNGSYDYSISTDNKTYSGIPSSGSIRINGSPLSVSTTFREVLYKITFTESGLPSGTVWYVNLTNGVDSGPITGSSYSLSLANGTYSYTIATANKIYSPLQSSGSFTVNGAAVSVPVTFSEVTYTATFTESGLPSATTWYVNLTGGMDSGPITGSSYSFSLSNGTFSYTLATSDKIYRPTSSSGSLTVNGDPVSEPVTFSKVTYTATFTESGLPSGTVWYVNLTNGVDSGPITESSYSISLTNGSYSYSIGTNNKTYSASGGSFTVDGAAVSESITFSEVMYTVYFIESGLPSGTAWYVNLSNGPHSGPFVGFSGRRLANGTYSYTIGSSNKSYKPSPSSGSFTVNGAPETVSVTFSKVLYNVTFTESGLPSGVEWYVNGSGISGHELSPTNITFNLANGTYSFTATNLSNYYTTTVHFSVVISGNNVTETVDYYHWAYIAGKVSPSNATVTINGKAVSLSSSGSFNVSVANGTYHVVASSPGYVSYYNNFTLNSGNSKNLTINLKPISKPSTISSTELYAIIGVVVAVAAILGVVFVKKRR